MAKNNDSFARYINKYLIIKEKKRRRNLRLEFDSKEKELYLLRNNILKLK